MNSTDFAAIAPLLILFGTSLLLLLVEMPKRVSCCITTGGFAASLLSSISPVISTNPLLTMWLQFDALAHFFTILFLSIGLFVAIISTSFFKSFEASWTEFYFFLLTSTIGLILISSANDFLTLFLGLETLSIALYVLTGYMKSWKISHEAAFKYFLLGSLSSAFLLFGIALLYGAFGSTNFDALKSYAQVNQTLFLPGIALISVSLLFKAACVPFHIWAPDVYDGAPTPVTAFMAVGTKAASFAALIRLFLTLMPACCPLWQEAIAFSAYLTLIYANFVAMRQIQLRRFFAYSGISHAGFLLIPLAAGGIDATSSMLFYIAIYTIATLGCFACLAFLDDTSDGVKLHDLKGLFYSSPWLASTFAFCLLTLGGIPPTVGFFAKFYLLKVAFMSGYYGLVVVGLLMAILAAYYYLRIVAVLFRERVEEKVLIRSTPTLACCTISFLFLICLSFYPNIIMVVF